MEKINIGTWPLSGDYGYISINEVYKILTYAFDKKFYEYDTAPSYGNGLIEFILGNVFNGEKKVKFNTKVGNHPFNGKSFEIFDIKKSLDNSLKRLRTNKINILYLHNPRLNSKKLEKLIDFLNNLKKIRIIRYSGISLAKNFNIENKILEKFDVIQDDANILSTNFLKYNLKNSQKFYGRSPFANGILTGSILKKFKVDDHRYFWLNSRLRKNTINHCLQILKKISKYELKELSFRFVNFNNKIDKNIFGIKKIDHIDNLIKFSKKKNVKSDKKIFEKINYLNKKKFFCNDNQIKFLY